MKNLKISCVSIKFGLKSCKKVGITNELNAIKILEKCNKQLFPLINMLLKILAVSTATPERSFLTLKRLKTYLRNAIG